MATKVRAIKELSWSDSIAIGLGLVLWAGGCGAEVIAVASRGESIRLQVDAPPAPAGVVVLFAGGHGALDIRDDGSYGWGRGNFLVRSAGLFTGGGLVSVVIDAPSDRIAQGLYHFRDGAEHARDVAAVIAHLRARFALPVFLAGTSRGSESVANAAIRLPGAEGPDAIVLSASVLVPNDGGTDLLRMDLGAIVVPTLIVHHRDDACRVTPFDRVDTLRERLTAAPVVAVLVYEGGVAQGNPCQARHHHGFNGIEVQVVDDVVTWLRANGVPR